MENTSNNLIDLKVSNDLVFQKIFGKVGNESITKRLIEKILDVRINNITLNTNKRMQLDTLDSKTGRLDVKAELEDGTVIHIEMQASEYEFMEERFVFYNDAVFLENVKMGKGYKFDRNRVIGILITDYDLKTTKGIPKYHTIWNYREKDYPENKLISNKELHIIELKKFEKYEENDEELAAWIKFLKVKGVADMQKVKNYGEALEKAKKELEFLASNREAQEQYLEREMQLRDYIYEVEYAKEKAEKEGREAGLEQRNTRAEYKSGIKQRNRTTEKQKEKQKERQKEKQKEE